MDEAERICGNCGKLARAHCNCSYHDLWNHISRLEAEPAKARTKLGKYLMMDDLLTVSLRADNARLRSRLESSWRLIPNPKEGESVVYLGVYVTRWRPEYGEPTVGFVRNDAEEEGR